MAKEGPKQITERQIRMLELRAEGKTLSEIGKVFGITPEGVRININFSLSLIKRNGLDAVLPAGVKTDLTPEKMLSLQLKRRKRHAKPLLDQLLQDAQSRATVMSEAGPALQGTYSK